MTPIAFPPQGGSPSDVPDAAALAEAYRGGMRSLAAGVCLITTRRGSEQGGMVATAVTSVSAEPPTLLICVNRNASIFEMVQASGRFCVNVLAKESVQLVEVFSNSARRAERFRTGVWHESAGGCPISGEALVSFDCRVAKMIDWHSHAIFLGEVSGVVHACGTATDAPRAPLLYMDRKFHRLAELTAG